MRHLIHKLNPTGKYKAVLLLKEASFNIGEIDNYYIHPLMRRGYDPQDIFTLSLAYNDAGKAPAKLMREHLEVVLRATESVEVKTLLVADASYFKQLTKLRKADPHFGYIKPCAIKGYEHLQVVLAVNYQALFYNPNLQQKLDRALDTMMDTLSGFHIEPGTDIIHSQMIIGQEFEFDAGFEELHKHDVLTVDVETRGLELHKGMLGTIAFAWDKHNGVIFNVSMHSGYYNQDIMHERLRKFFQEYEGKCIYHGATFDIKVLIFELFMRDWNDKSGMIQGLETMTKNIECTKIITYLATNSTAGNKLDLKSNAAEFAGNYAQDDITDITQIPLPDLLEYNLIDCLATWFVYEKYWPKILDENQQHIYETVLRPSIKLVVQMELVGMPLDKVEVSLAQAQLSRTLWRVEKQLLNSQVLIDCYKRLKFDAFILKRDSLKRKVIKEEDFKFDPFNPNSNQQVSYLLHEYIKLDVIDLTPTKQPSVGASTLKKHLNQLISKYSLTDEDLK